MIRCANMLLITLTHRNNRRCYTPAEIDWPAASVYNLRYMSHSQSYSPQTWHDMIECLSAAAPGRQFLVICLLFLPHDATHSAARPILRVGEHTGTGARKSRMHSACLEITQQPIVRFQQMFVVWSRIACRQRSCDLNCIFRRSKMADGRYFEVVNAPHLNQQEALLSQRAMLRVCQ